MRCRFPPSRRALARHVPGPRTPRALGALVVLAAAAAGCGGGDAPGADQAFSGPAPGTGYTSDQLQQALLTDVPGYQRAGEPESGEYGSLDAIQNFNQLQDQVKLDKPQCADTAQGFDSEQQTAPAAITIFTKGSGQNATEMLMRVPEETANHQVAIRVPASCRSFRARVGGQWSTHRVVEATHGRLGEGSRTVGVATSSGTSQVKTWYVVLKGRGYLAAITLYGPNVTRVAAEQLARRAYDQAERILP